MAESGVDPALHYLLRGNIEGRRPSAAFDGVKYYRDHPSVLAAGENPLIHHLRSGKQGKAGTKAADGVPQNRLMLPKRLAVRVLKSLRNAKFYLDRERYRTTRIIRKSGLFDEDWYLRTYPDVARNGAIRSGTTSSSATPSSATPAAPSTPSGTGRPIPTSGTSARTRSSTT